MPQEIRKLAERSAAQSRQGAKSTPVATTAEKIEQCVYFVDKDNKSALLATSSRDEAREPRARLHPHQARRGSGREEPRAVRHPRRSDPRQQDARTPASGRSSNFKDGTHSACWSRPTSPPAASTSTASRTWSTTTCRTSPRPTCIASAARPARAHSGIAFSFCEPDERGNLRHRAAHPPAHPSYPHPARLRTQDPGAPGNRGPPGFR